MKYWDIIAAPDAGIEKLAAYIRFAVDRRKALQGKKIKVVHIPYKKGANSYGRDSIPF